MSKRYKIVEKSNIKFNSDQRSKDLSLLIEKLTHSGSKTLNQNELKEMTCICQHSDKYVNEAFNIVMKYLREDHAEVRFSAFQIADEIFRCSESFRKLLMSNLEDVVELTITKTLPPPNRVAKELTKMAVKSIYQWNITFGRTFPKLVLGYNFLLENEKVFADIIKEIEGSTSERNDETTKKQKLITNSNIKRILAEIKENEPEIVTAVTSLTSCINLLLPHPEDFFIVSEEDDCESSMKHSDVMSDSDDDGEEDPHNTELREVGISSVNQSIELDFIPSTETYIKETPENSAIIENAKEHAMLIRKRYLSTVENWLESIKKSPEYKCEQKKILKLKGDLDDAMFKFNQMVFVSAEEVSSDSDLEEVEVMHPNDSKDTEGNGDTAEKLVDEEKPSTSKVLSRKERLMAIAPKRPYDVDLYHWEDTKLPIPTMIPSSTEGHRFWVAADSNLEEVPVPEGSAALRTRVIEFAGNFTPVAHVCRVKLPSGKLCPRRDRIKCPFHGEIVPRDETGRCINPQDAIRMQQLAEKRQQKNPDWQNPRLLAELKKTTGLDLKMPEKGKRTRKKKYPGLTDLKQIENTTKKRLEKKIFKKDSMKRVAATMDRLDKRRLTDKFGDQFNYLYNT